ncbi:MAG: alkaline phosphatase D family protein [Abitibacteriaceae bacterium]|nr:alkaline phosphatase D family protein [Abditibacteriaceae bacterium]MBV9866668.1 alkaline phosphatase D family protein [Abditibacteriaceae bacterium]
MLSLRVGPLVRATSADSAVIWVELSHPGTITITATPQQETTVDGPERDTSAESITPAHIVTSRTVCVGNRYYAAPQLRGLQPATWYRYTIQAQNDQSTNNQSTAPQPQRVVPHQCFRTLDNPASQYALTLAYGSCRRLVNPRQDTLSALGRWLVQHYEDRENRWPRLLLLIGDQIYADAPSSAAIRQHASLRGGARDFSNFAALYEFSWTHDTSVRQALATVPTYMICDDHEITNGWNTVPFWRAAQLKQGNEQLLVDGLVAYWIYQGWGNLLQRNVEDKPRAPDEAPADDPRLQIMAAAAQSGDALEELRTCMRQSIYGKTRLQWYYSIPTSPPLFVSDARTDREERLAPQPIEPGAETSNRIMSQQQMDMLKSWLATHQAQPAVLVSSVPVLLPPLIGFAEYVMGRRFGPQSSRIWHLIAHLMGHLQQKFGEKAQFDHWPVFAQTWDEVVDLLKTQPQEILVLSGDVHFSYTMEARLKAGKATDASDGAVHKSSPRLLQFVCSPIDNRLGTRSRRKILAQSWLQQGSYGGLQTCIRPLYASYRQKAEKRVCKDLLFGNSLAFVSFQPQANGSYHIQQEYMGVDNGHLKPRAKCQLQTQRSVPT